MKLSKQVVTILIHVHTKNKRNPHHRFREKCKLAIGDYGHFLENRALDWSETCHVGSSYDDASSLKISWNNSSRFARYP